MARIFESIVNEKYEKLVKAHGLDNVKEARKEYDEAVKNYIDYLNDNMN